MWIKNLRDNGITRQRYWGTPLPVWRCGSCKQYIVIGSINELKKYTKDIPEDLHKPWIDMVSWKCSCGGEMKRIPDILDVWVDAGSVSWNCLDYPKHEELFKEMFPADFILEGIDQIRGWFNLLLVASMVALNKPSFKAVYMHGFINDALGRKMSKSLGNYILPQEVIEQYGADTLRYYMLGGTKAGVDINYNFDDMKVKNKNLNVLWNMHKYLVDYSLNAGINPAELDAEIIQDEFSIEEEYMFSKLHSTIRKVTELYEQYRIDEVPIEIEELYLSLSRTYIKLTREKLADNERNVVLYTIYTTLMETLKLFATVAPFISEKMYLNIKEAFNLKEESIHLHDWPSYDEKKINKDIEASMESASSLVQAALSAREKINLGVRWPLKELLVATKDDATIQAVERLKDIIKIQLNVKDIGVIDVLKSVKLSAKPDYNQLNPDFKEDAPKIIANLAIESPETVMQHIEKEGKYVLKVDGKSYNIVKEHLIVQRTVPYPLVEAEIKNGFIYLNQERTDELEAEGYAREITRRIQAGRKKAGLEVKDRISLYLKTDAELAEMLSDWQDQIQEKVGADVLKISENEPAKQHAFRTKEKVKDKEFEICFDRI
jgi:isoleucyl-tRNA synthetase